MFCQLLVSVLLLAPASAMPEEKIDGKLLIGKWEPEKLPEQLEKLVVEYKKDGKMEVEITAQGQMQKFEGTYKLEGDKLSIKVDFGGQEQNQKRKIIKLTDKEMVTNDEEKSEERKYKRAK